LTGKKLGRYDLPVKESVVTSKGTTTIPLAIRQKLGIEAGTTLTWAIEGGAILARKKSGRYIREGASQRRQKYDMGQRLAQEEYSVAEGQQLVDAILSEEDEHFSSHHGKALPRKGDARFDYLTRKHRGMR